MATKLDEIIAHTRQQVATRKAAADYKTLEQRAAAHAPRGFTAALRTAALDRPAIISEIKKASPSKGLIRADFHPVSLAQGFEAAGAAALSVLTNERFFQGSLEYLEAASAAVSIPCLRKDFMVDRFQVLEARASSADAILLIVAALSDKELSELRDEAQKLGLDVLCEVHDRDELDRAVQLGFDLIGVNSRDLRTFTVRLDLLTELAQWKPADTIMVAESGISTIADIAKYRSAGYEAFLVGEALMRQVDPGAALATLLEHEYSSEI
jgi:indole-3-glycerol phosphate synthase